MTFSIPSFRATLRSDAESTRRMDSASCDFVQDDAPDGSAQNDACVSIRRRDACAPMSPPSLFRARHAVPLRHPYLCPSGVRQFPIGSG